MRNVALVVAGAIVGAFVITYLGSGAWDHSVELDGPIIAGSTRADSNSSADVSVNDAIQLSGTSILQRVAATRDVDAMRRLLDEFTAQPPSRRRQFWVEVLIARYAELDPAGAIAALRALDEKTDIEAVVTALLAVIGDEQKAMAQIDAALPPHVDVKLFRAKLIASQKSPLEALRGVALIEDESTQLAVLHDIAAESVKFNPRKALVEIKSISNHRVREAAENTLLREWARLDPTGVIAYLGEHEGHSARQAAIARTILQEVVGVSPETMLALADRLPLVVGDLVRREAVTRLAEQHPRAALDYVASRPSGLARQVLLQSIARPYAIKSPEAALAWSREVESSASLTSHVIAAVAEFDAKRALDMALTLESSGERLESLEVLGVVSGQPERLATEMLASPDSDLRDRAIEALATAWVSRDRDAAIEWLIANSSLVSARAFGRVAERLGAQDPVVAAQYTTRMYGDARSAWIQAIAHSYGSVDPQAAANWVMQFAGEPGHNAALSAVARATARHNPQTAAQLLAMVTNTSDGTYQGTAEELAYFWAERDPTTAAQWAANTKHNVRNAALAAVAQQWSRKDKSAATSWAATLPEGEERDAALVAIFSEVSGYSSPDERLLLSLSTADARRRAVESIVFNLARYDRKKARQWVETTLREPTLRQQGERALVTQ